VADPLAEIRALFRPAPGTIYLDSATYGLPPRPTVDALRAAADGWQAGTASWVDDWDRRGEVARAAFARLIDVPPDTVALMPAVSVGVGLVAATLTERDEVVIPDDEFNSVLYPMLVAAQARGVRVRQAPFASLADHVRPSTTLVAFSLVQSQSGRTASQSDILDAAQRVGARTLIDATHAVPFVPVDPRADVVVCAAYKHLLCPRGVAFLSVARPHWERLPAWLANWRSTPEPYAVGYGGPLQLASDAARFDVSLAWFAWVGAAVSLELLVDWRQRGALAEPVALAGQLAHRLGLPAPVGTIVSVPVEDAERVRAELASAGVKGAVRAGSVRLSTHVYNTVADVEQAAAALARFVRVRVAG
jgi:selenocysteine lyase/cysteine desulfurase